MRRDPFRPSLNGFRFANARAEPATTFGLGAPMLPAFGLSAGMAWVALDRYLAGRPMPSDANAPQATDPLYAELVMRQANALAVVPWSRLVEWQCLPERSLPGRPSLATWSRAQWRRTRKSLDAGVPMMLFLVVGTGRHANPSLNKAVLAVGYEIERKTRSATVLLYDPDWPGVDSVRLVFRTGHSGPLGAHIGEETSVRGFMAVPYDRAIPASLSLETTNVAGPLAVNAPVAMVAAGVAGGPVAILARKRDRGGLLSARRDRRGRWSTEELPEAASEDLVTDTGATAWPAPDRVLTRTADGDLLDVRRYPLLGWRVRNVTRAKSIGQAFRIEGNIAVLPRHGFTVMACGQGKLLRYRRRPGRTWSADLVDIGLPDGVRLVGTPALVRKDALHVLCRTDSGDLMHFHERSRGGWAGSSITIRPGGRARFVVADDPIALNDPDGRILNAVTRSRNSAVLLFRKTGDHAWSGVDLSYAVRSAGHDLPYAASRLSALVDEGGTVHVAGRDVEGGLIHIWCARNGAVGGERVTDHLPGCREGVQIDGVPLLAMGPAGALHIVAHRENRLLLFRWTPVAGWSVEDVSRERGVAGALELESAPVLECVDYTTHIAFADGAGTLHTACLSSAKPRRVAATSRASAAVRPVPAARSPATGNITGPATHVPPAVASPEPAEAPPATGPVPVAKVRPRRKVPPAQVPEAPAAVAGAPAMPSAQERRGPEAAPRPGPAPRSDRDPGAPAKWRVARPAVEALPLLADDDSDAPHSEDSGATAGAPPVRPEPARPRSNAKEIRRIMALGEKSPAELIKPD